MAKRLDRFTQPFVQSRIPFLLTEVLTDGHGKMTDLVCRFANSAAGTLLGLPPFGIKYEKCEIILCEVDESLKHTGITVMDGPFFSLMPFGQTGLHSLTSVTFTPHETSYDTVATFPCQAQSGGRCKPGSLYNCNECPAKPATAWPYMSQLARKYLKEEYGFSYKGSLFSMKPILKASEIDDSRPTVVRRMSDTPVFYSVLSGKINTVYDLDEVLAQ